MNPRLETDSSEYEILTNAVLSIKDVAGMLCEIGTRRGGSLAHIVNALGTNNDYDRNIVFIDPYGDIEYAHKEGIVRKLDYTNRMRNDTLGLIYNSVAGHPVNPVPMIMEDTEFFKRFADGVPFYANGKKLETEYALVFFDGPHDFASVLREIEFFNPRTPVGGVWVFDDTGFYDHSRIELEMFRMGWGLKEKGKVKASYVKGSA